MAIHGQLLSDAALANRSRVAAEDWRLPAIGGGGGRPAQVVVKVIGGRRGPEAVMSTARYVGREGGAFSGKGERPQLFDETGLPVDRARDGLARWDLVGDAENLSKRARDLCAEGRQDQARRLSDRERLANVQAWHLTFSLRAAEGQRADVTARLEEAMALTVAEAFAQVGRPALWTVHEDGSHPHAHVVVRSKDWSGRRLRFDANGDMVDSLKEVFVRHARSLGLNVTGERREDRSDVRNGVANGTQPVRQNVRRAEAKGGVRDLALQVPEWFVRHADGYAGRVLEWDALDRRAEAEVFRRRQDGEMGTRPPPEAANSSNGGRLPPAEPANSSNRGRRPPRFGRIKRMVMAELLPKAGPSPAETEIPERLRPVYRRIRECFVDPVAALEAWGRMAAEGSHRDEDGRMRYPKAALASWYLRKQPLAFGQITASALELAGDRAFAEALKRIEPGQWRRAELGSAAVEKAQIARRRLQAIRVDRRRRRDRGIVAGSLHRLGRLVEGRFQAETRAGLIHARAAEVMAGRLPTPEAMEMGARGRPGSLLDRLVRTIGERLGGGRSPQGEWNEPSGNGRRTNETVGSERPRRRPGDRDLT